MKTQEINYSLGDQNFKAYVAHPELDKAPLILIAHTWAGKDDFVELKEMTEAGADWQLHSYGNAYHAFTNPDADDLDFGVQYNKNADKRSWQSMMNFFSEIF